MAREILFKAKTEMIVRTYNNGLDDGEWVQGYLRCDCGMWLIYQFEYDRADQVAYEVNPETICQYTGLTDMNGNKIWENDVAALDSLAGFVVEYDIENARFIFNGEHKDVDYGHCGFHLYARKEIEVIGNIFDNPELLGGGE